MAAFADEIHNVPDTETGKDCWIAVYHPTKELPFLSVFHYATSKATGWDLPADYRDWPG